MKHLSFKIGYWSAISLLITFAVWIISFVGIALTSPLFYWTNLDDYIIHFQTGGHFFQNLAYLFMLLVGPIYLLLINGYYEYAPDHKKALVRISLLFALGFAILSSLHYFVQLSSVRLNLVQGNFDGMQHFLQANPVSVMTSIDMLGWTFFLGLSSFFIYPVFKVGKAHRFLRYAFLFNGFSCIFAGLAYVFQIDVLTFIFINLGVGGAMMAISIASLRLFGRKG